MNAETAKKTRWTPEAYLVWERAAAEKHELVRGEIFAISGATRRQNDGSWVLWERRAGEQLELRSVRCTVAVDEIYLRVLDGAGDNTP